MRYAVVSDFYRPLFNDRSFIETVSHAVGGVSCCSPVPKVWREIMKEACTVLVVCFGGNFKIAGHKIVAF